MKDITVILPIHDIRDANFETLFGLAIKSIQTQIIRPEKLLVVHCDCPGVGPWLNKFDYGDLNVEILENTTQPDFCSQINFAANKVDTTWFSILEFDDEYSNIWFKNVKEYFEAYPEAGILLPLVLDVDDKGNFINFTNEACWAMNFSEKLGSIDNGTLLNYQNFQTSGSVINVEEFNSVGGLKAGIALTFVYEFLLRATYNDIKVMTVPKVGYKHTNMRPGSLFWEYKNGERLKLEPEVAKFWIDTAKKEYFFKDDRQITYTPSNN